MEGKRLFVSLDFPFPVRKALFELDPHLPVVHWVRPAQLHLTLAFLGQVSPVVEERLRNQLAGLKFTRFFLPLNSLDTFPVKGRPKIIWLGVGRGHPHLFQLHKSVTDAALGAGLQPDLRPWHPHLTLARCQDVARSSIQRFLRENADYDAGLVLIDSFQLNSSRPTPAGSFYRTELTVEAVGSRRSR